MNHSLPRKHICESTSLIDMDLNTLEQCAQNGKYTEQNGAVKHFCNYFIVEVKTSPVCPTVQVITSCNKVGDLKFGNCILDRQIAKFNSLPIFQPNSILLFLLLLQCGC